MDDHLLVNRLPRADVLVVRQAAEPGHHPAGSFFSRGMECFPFVMYGRSHSPVALRSAHGRHAHRVFCALVPASARRRAEKTSLHKVVAEHLESWLGWHNQAERPVPGHVEEELRGYLECGMLCFGFARALCTGCGTGFVVAFSCKGRGVCPSCNVRHMAQTAAIAAITRIFLAEIERFLLTASGVTSDADTPKAARIKTRRHLLPAPLWLGAQPSCAPARVRDRWRVRTER